MQGSFEKYGNNVSYNITDEQKDKICETLIEYYSTHLHFGEGIMQDDESIIDAPGVLAEICDDIIEFVEEDKDEC